MNAIPPKKPIAAQTGGGLTAAQLRKLERSPDYLDALDKIVALAEKEERAYRKLRRATNAYHKARVRVRLAVNRRDRIYRDTVKELLDEQIRKEGAADGQEGQEAR